MGEYDILNDLTNDGAKRLRDNKDKPDLDLLLQNEPCPTPNRWVRKTGWGKCNPSSMYAAIPPTDFDWERYFDKLRIKTGLKKETKGGAVDDDGNVGAIKEEEEHDMKDAASSESGLVTGESQDKTTANHQDSTAATHATETTATASTSISGDLCQHQPPNVAKPSAKPSAASLSTSARTPRTSSSVSGGGSANPRPDNLSQSALTYKTSSSGSHARAYRNNSSLSSTSSSNSGKPKGFGKKLSNMFK